ncbi:MAG TPA: O-antigen ligase family protein, partial [Candidatus Woesebacteria bacterium]|nr:O-antigen ligase family protein [Candidatus Woesebacteria bacterium]
MENSLDRWLKRALVSLFHFGALALPLVFAFNTEELFEFNKMIFVYIWAIITALIWLARMIVQKKVLLVKTPFDLPIIGYIVSQLLATLFSIHPYTSLFGYYSRFHGGLVSTLAYVTLFYAFVATFVGNSQSKKTPFLSQPIAHWLLSLVIGSVLASLYALPEHFGYSFSCQLATGAFNVSCWVQDVQNRVFGSFGQPNWLAAYLILLIPIGISSLLFMKKRLVWISLLSITTLWYCVVLFTKSRSGLLGFGVSLVFLLGWFALAYFTHSWSIKKVALKQILIRFSLIGFLLLTSTLYFGTPLTPSITQLLNKSEAPKVETFGPALEAGGTESGEIRKIVWQGAIDVWKRYPFFGSGLETFAYSYYQDRPTTHNLVSEWDFL